MIHSVSNAEVQTVQMDGSINSNTPSPRYS